VSRPDAPAVLLLGGTDQARAVATRLDAEGWDVTTSLAGRTTNPRSPAGVLRVGGFGGADGLGAWLREHRPACVVDATHPFAAQMTAHADEACRAAGVPLLRLVRPAWARTRPDAAEWDWVADHDEAARAVLRLLPTAQTPGTVLLSVGRQHTPAYLPLLSHHSVLARVAEARDLVVPPAWRVIVSRGPFQESQERALFAEADVRVLVSKDSGGTATAAKLDIAAERGARVVMIARPPTLPGTPEVSDLEEATRWCRAVVRGVGRPAAG